MPTSKLARLANESNSDAESGSASTILLFPESLRRQANNGVPHVRFKVLGDDDDGPCCHLFIPQGFSVPDNASYTSIDLGTAGGTESAIANDGNNVTAADAVGGLASAGGLVGQAVGSASAGAALGGITKLRQGIASNPYTETQYTGSGVRSFGFQFKLMSQSSKEANTALAIEHFFRENMYPEDAGAFQLKYPNRFKINFYNGDAPNKFMPTIKECYLTTLNTTYNSTTNAFHDKGQPVEIDIAATFQEVKALTRNDLYDTEVDSEGDD